MMVLERLPHETGLEYALRCGAREQLAGWTQIIPADVSAGHGHADYYTLALFGSPDVPDPTMTHLVLLTREQATKICAGLDLWLTHRKADTDDQKAR